MFENKWVKLILTVIGCVIAWKIITYVINRITGAVFSLIYWLVPIAVAAGIAYLLFFRKRE